MKFRPHNYQLKAMNFLIRNPIAALFLSMGLGKTAIVLSVIQRLQERGKIGPVLILAPLRVIYSVWRQEAKKWDHTKNLRFSILHGPDKNSVLFGDNGKKGGADIYLINYDGIKWLVNALLREKERAEEGYKTGKKLAKLQDITRAGQQKWRPPFNMLVADESSALKAHDTERFRLLKKLLPLFKRRVLLTGTPAPNNLMNLWSQFFILDEGKRLDPSFYRFRNRYFQKADYFGYRYRLRKGAANKIYSRVNEITLRLSSENNDYLYAPEIIYNQVSSKLPADVAREIYQPLERDFFLQFDNDIGRDSATVSVANSAVLSLKLRQVIQGGLYTENGLRFIHDTKIKILEEIVEQSQGQPILVAYQFLFEVEKLKEVFGQDLPVIGGMTSGAKAAKIVDKWNQGKLPLLVAHPGSLSHGVNLQAGGNTIVWLAPTWSFENYSQFNARLHRQGQRHPVIVHHLITQRTVDEAVFTALQQKERQQDALLAALEKYRREKVKKNP